jgi:hypothetical protein
MARGYGPNAHCHLHLSDWYLDTVFPHFGALRVVELRVPVDDPEWDNTEAAPTVQRLLGAAPLLEQATIFFKARSGAQLLPRNPPSPWAMFHSGQPNQTPVYLRAMKCFLSLSPSFPDDRVDAYNNFAPWIEAQMPALRGTSLLTCSQGLPEKYASWDTWPA